MALIVWSLADNQGALDFYWRRGGRPVAETVELIGGAKLKKIAFELTEKLRNSTSVDWQKRESV